jgi:hypothetical protein
MLPAREEIHRERVGERTFVVELLVNWTGMNEVVHQVYVQA